MLASSAAAQDPPRDDDDRVDPKDLKRDLRSPWPDARRRAVKKLAALGTDEGWELVLESLADRDGQVADTAQVALGEISDPQIVDGLFGRAGLAHKDLLVRERVAEALGRLAMPVDGRALARALDVRAPGVSRMLLWSIERLARAERLAGDPAELAEAIDGELRNNRADEVRAAALATLAVLDAPRAERLARFHRRDASPAVRAAALEAAIELELADRFGWIEAALADAAPSVRAAAVRAVALAPSRPALEILARLVVEEPRTSLRARVLEVLRAATGYHHGPNPNAWRATLASIPADWDGTPLVAPKPAAGGATTLAELARLDPCSDRLAILIDFSGSLWNERGEGVTRKQLLDPEFKELVAALPRDARFNVVPYTGVPHPFQERLVAAEPRRVLEVQTAYERWSMRGQGDAFGAIQTALADPDVDRILLLTDGAPTGGARWDLPLMVELLLEQNRFRHVVFDVVLIDAPKGTARRWERLTASTGGRLLSVAFPGGDGAAPGKPAPPRGHAGRRSRRYRKRARRAPAPGSLPAHRRPAAATPRSRRERGEKLRARNSTSSGSGLACAAWRPATSKPARAASASRPSGSSARNGPTLGSGDSTYSTPRGPPRRARSDSVQPWNERLDTNASKTRPPGLTQRRMPARSSARCGSVKPSRRWMHETTSKAPSGGGGSSGVGSGQP